MKRKRMFRDIAGFTATGMTLGVGASALGAMPDAPAGASQGMANMAGFMPVTGSIMGAGYTMRELNRLGSRRKRLRRFT